MSGITPLADLLLHQVLGRHIPPAGARPSVPPIVPIDAIEKSNGSEPGTPRDLALRQGAAGPAHAPTGEPANLQAAQTTLSSAARALLDAFAKRPGGPGAAPGGKPVGAQTPPSAAAPGFYTSAGRLGAASLAGRDARAMAVTLARTLRRSIDASRPTRADREQLFVFREEALPSGPERPAELPGWRAQLLVRWDGLFAPAAPLSIAVYALDQDRRAQADQEKERPTRDAAGDTATAWQLVFELGGEWRGRVELLFQDSRLAVRVVCTDEKVRRACEAGRATLTERLGASGFEHVALSVVVR